MRIVCNSAKCLKCNDVVVSKHRHDFSKCFCGSMAVDGGHEYLKRVGEPENIEDLSVVTDSDVLLNDLVIVKHCLSFNSLNIFAEDSKYLISTIFQISSQNVRSMKKKTDIRKKFRTYKSVLHADYAINSSAFWLIIENVYGRDMSDLCSNFNDLKPHVNGSAISREDFIKKETKIAQEYLNRVDTTISSVTITKGTP